ncbi:MAG: hypothetical protein GX818_00040 [Tissierellia bacterium]|nr:hypothetical protein [Tissierellia bacterium]
MTKDERRSIWGEKINNYRNSNMTAIDWCNENNVSIHSLKSWITKFNKEQNPHESKETEWLAVELPKPNNISPTSSIIIKIGSCSIEIARDFDKTVLADVVQVLTSLC